MIARQGQRPLRVMHLITGTNVGGAETMLVNLLSKMDRKLFHNIVYSMLEPGPAAERIRALGVEVQTLGMVRGSANPLAFVRLAKAVLRWQPDVVHTWMYHANLLGGLVGGLLCGVPVAWGIHHSDLDRETRGGMTIRVARFCGLISGWVPKRIVCCAESSRIIHVGLGYSDSKMTVIPNGFDLGKYCPRADAPSQCALRFGIPPHLEVVSLIARYDPQKDHATFIAAAKICRSSFPEARYVLCGDGISQANGELLDLIRRAAMEDRVMLLGRLEPDEIALVMSRSSVTTTSSSWGEAFPMVVGEAMACGTVCVVTDVGDSAFLVGDTGIVVRPSDPDALAAGWVRVLSMTKGIRRSMGKTARRRVEERFSLPVIASRYQALYVDLGRNGEVNGICNN